MAKNKKDLLTHKKDQQRLNLKVKVLKYLRYWPWFVIAAVIALVMGYIYLRYTPVTYETTAKIKIIDDSPELNIASEASIALLGNQSAINLENQIEVLKSYRLLSEVVEALNLDVAVNKVGNVKTYETWDNPFVVTKKPMADSLDITGSYYLEIQSSKLKITDGSNRITTMNLYEEDTVSTLPFIINFTGERKLKDYIGRTFEIVLKSENQAVMQLINAIDVQPTNRVGDILTLSIVGENIARSEAILNTVIEKFNKDGILDRRLVSERTVNFIDNRFVYLTQELDSIEGSKKTFKQNNNLAYIEADAEVTLEKKSVAEDEVFKLQTQIALSRLLKQTITEEKDFSLLPANIGLENSSINNLVNDYNKIVQEREKLLASAGKNNPTLQALSGQLEQGKQNVVQTVNMYQNQLKVSLGQLGMERSIAGAKYSSLPGKEQILRSIERQQGIKENLFLLLLQKREEAAINLAVTAPSIKVVDFALSSNTPVSPNRNKTLGMFLLAGLLLPFVVLYTKFSLDTKIHNRLDVEKLNSVIPILTEIPRIEDTKTLIEANDHSVLAESFRILSTNVNYLLQKKEDGFGHVIYVTSTVKGEGKTLMSVNLSLAFASLKKRVLLIGADLRNPTLHHYFKKEKNVVGLSNYLHNPDLDLQSCIQNGLGNNDYLDVCLGGPIPPNAPELFSNHNFEEFLNKAKKQYDYVIVDTAPTMLVADTMLISKYADLTLFVVRADFTEKHLLEFSKDLNATKKLRKMAYVINDVSRQNVTGYNYGYGYGYGQNIKAQSKPWFRTLFG